MQRTAVLGQWVRLKIDVEKEDASVARNKAVLGRLEKGTKQYTKRHQEMKLAEKRRDNAKSKLGKL
jgi:hypothetical protein